MTQPILTIALPMPFRLGSVNCYLAAAGSGFVLIDTGASNQRSALERELASAGCKAGDLKLIVITHGDFDHIGNAAYLRRKFGAKIAMHQDDAGMAERGDMFWNRKSGNVVMRTMVPVLLRFGRADRFEPDLAIGDGYNLAEFGLDATVLSLPGHSKGSIGVVTASGDLFCGDLFENTKEPALNSIMDDLAAANASVARLSSLAIGTVYPGHGQPFPMQQFSLGAG
jgi:hydroxyacylglutathione hydrolase